MRKTMAVLTALIVLAAAMEFLVGFQRVAVPGGVFDILRLERGMSPREITALGVWFMVVFALAQFVTGPMADRLGGVVAGLVDGACFVAGALLFPLARSTWAMVAARMLAGFGASGVFLALLRLVVDAFPRQRSILISVMVSVSVAGSVCGGAPLAACLSRFSFQEVFLAAALISLAVYALFALLGFAAPKPAPASGPRTEVWADLKMLLGRRHNWRMLVFCGINFGACYVLQTVIGKKFLEDYCGMQSISAAWVISAMGVSCVLGGMLFAVASQSCGNRRKCFIVAAAATTAAVFAALLAQIGTGNRTGWLAGALMIALATPSCISGVTIPYMQETNDERLIGTTTALLNFCSFMMVAVFGRLTGWLLQRFPAGADGVYGSRTYLALFVILGALSLVPLAVTCTLVETHGKHIEVR